MFLRVHPNSCNLDFLYKNILIIIISRRKHNTCLIPFQYLLDGAELYFIDRLIVKAISKHVQLSTYINVSLTQWYNIL